MFKCRTLNVHKIWFERLYKKWTGDPIKSTWRVVSGIKLGYDLVKKFVMFKGCSVQTGQLLVLWHFGGVTDSTGCVQLQAACREWPMVLVNQSSWIKSSWQQLLIPTGCVKQAVRSHRCSSIDPVVSADLDRLFPRARLLRGRRT